MLRKGCLALLCGMALCLAFLPAKAMAEEGNIPINAQYFPNEAFQQYLRDEFDANGDGVLSQEERNPSSYV